MSERERGGMRGTFLLLEEEGGLMEVGGGGGCDEIDGGVYVMSWVDYDGWGG